MKNIVVAHVSHESNTFNPIITRGDDYNIYLGNEIFSYLTKNDTISGIIASLQELSYKPLPVISARAVPNGVVDLSLYEEIKEHLVAGFREQAKKQEIHGIALALHGSMRVEKLGEAEGDILAVTRAMFPDIPLVVALDMHASITPAMLRNCNALVGYKEAPHIDCYETGAHAVAILHEMLAHHVTATMSWVALPMLIAGEQAETNVAPMKEMIAGLRDLEQQENILALSYFLGFPWADCAENGVSVLAVTKDDRQLADTLALQLAKDFWERRVEFRFHTESYQTEEALAQALDYSQEQKNCPVYVSDSGDNPTAGSSGDCTNFLRALLRLKEGKARDKRIYYAGIYDPDTVAFCQSKVGLDLEISLGAKFDRSTTQPLATRARVLACQEGYGNYQSTNVLLDISGVYVIVSSKHIGFINPDLFTFFGLSLGDVDIICVKLGYLTAEHKAIAKKTVMALSEGSSNELLATLSYRHVQRPMYPLDTDFRVEIGLAKY